jgi:hypothetical protein
MPWLSVEGGSTVPQQQQCGCCALIRLTALYERACTSNVTLAPPHAWIPLAGSTWAALRWLRVTLSVAAGQRWLVAHAPNSQFSVIMLIQTPLSTRLQSR